LHTAAVQKAAGRGVFGRRFAPRAPASRRIFRADRISSPASERRG